MAIVVPVEWNRERIVAARPLRTATLNPFKPHAFFLEEELAATGRVVSSGTILLTNKECPWRCLMCDLWKNTLTETVPSGAIPQQIEFALAQLNASPEQIKLYNSGSFFDPAAIPLADYAEIARKISFAKNVVVESHPRLIGEKALRLRDRLSASLEVAMGLETIHPQVLPRLNKRFNLDHFSHAAEFLHNEGIALRAFVLVKPPFMDDAAGIEWAVKSATFAFDCGAAVVSLIPTRGGNGALERLRDTGEFAPPRLATLERALEQALDLKSPTAECAHPRAQQHEHFKRAQDNHASRLVNVAAPEDGRTPETMRRVFADTWDLERFAACPVCLDERRQRLLTMNLSQKMLPRVYCQSCGGA